MNEHGMGRVVTVVGLALTLVACSGSGSPEEADTATGTVTFPSSVTAPLETIPPVSDGPAVSTGTVAPRIPNEGSAEVIRQRWRYLRPGPPGPLTVEHGVPPALLPPGVHTTDVLGIEVTFELDDWWRLDGEEVGSVALTRPDTPIDGLLPFVDFIRPVGLVEPGRVSDENLLAGEGLKPPDDLGQWLDDVDQIEILASGPAAAGDRTGTWFDIDVDPGAGPTISGCSPGSCVHTWWAGANNFYNARDLESIRYYEFPDRNGPIYVLVVAADDEWNEWIDRAEELIRTTRFGRSVPHPAVGEASVAGIRGHAAGEPIRLVEFPGLVITPERRSQVAQQPGRLQVDPWGPGCCVVRSVYVRPVRDADGTPLGSIDEVIDVFAAAGLERGEDESIGGEIAAVFTGRLDQPVLRFMEVADGDDPGFVEWPVMPLVQVWVLDSPIGPLVLAAEADQTSRFRLAVQQARALGEATSFD